MKKINKFLFTFVALLSLTSCGGFNGPEGDTITITDITNREVEVVKNPERIACIGPGCLRMYSYVADAEKIVGIETFELNKTEASRPYIHKYGDLTKYPVIGLGGPKNQPDAELLIDVEPDVIFSCYSTDPSIANELQKNSHIPVVNLVYNANGLFAEDVYKSMQIIGKVTGFSKRANEVVEYFETARKQIWANIKDNLNPAGVYLGCNSFQGAHGIEGTNANYTLFNALGLNNLAKQENIKENGTVDLERILDIDPEYIILDAGGLGKLKESYIEKKATYESISAFKNGKAHIILPFNTYCTNLETALADLYYLASIFYPTIYGDINIKDKYNEISNYLLGYDFYDTMSNANAGACRVFKLSDL